MRAGTLVVRDFTHGGGNSEGDRSMSLADLTVRAARVQRGWLLVALAATVAAGCYREPTRWDQVQQETQGKKAVEKAAIHGSEFNKFFPKDGDGYSVVPAQEKAGYSEYNVKKDGETIATIAVFDTVSNPEALDDYKESQETLDGYPLVDKGDKGNAVLVADRLQVQVRSKDANVDKAQRLEWLKKFDLANLGQFVKTR